MHSKTTKWKSFLSENILTMNEPPYGGLYGTGTHTILFRFGFLKSKNAYMHEIGLAFHWSLYVYVNGEWCPGTKY